MMAGLCSAHIRHSGALRAFEEQKCNILLLSFEKDQKSRYLEQSVYLWSLLGVCSQLHLSTDYLSPEKRTEHSFHFAKDPTENHQLPTQLCLPPALSTPPAVAALMEGAVLQCPGLHSDPVQAAMGTPACCCCLRLSWRGQGCVFLLAPFPPNLGCSR